MNNDNIIEEKSVEYAERATIVYANFTGRDEKYRAQFRQEMLNLYRTALLEVHTSAEQAGYARAMGEAKTRDMIAGMALQGMLQNPNREVRGKATLDILPKYAYEYADKMLEVSLSSLTPTDNNKDLA